MDLAPCVVTLAGESETTRAAACSDKPWSEFVRFEQDDVDRNHDGYRETVLAITLEPARGCTCVKLRLELDRDPLGFVVNIGDSPTNDGFGGDDGTTRHDAELELVNSKLSLYGRDFEGAGGTILGVERNLTLELPELGDSVFVIEVCDQLVRISVADAKTDRTRLSTVVATPLSQRLFSLSGQDRSPRMGDPDHRDYTLWLGVNRAIGDTRGVPTKGRYGEGARSVTLSLSP